MCGNPHKIYSIVSDVPCVECLSRWMGVLHFRDVCCCWFSLLWPFSWRALDLDHCCCFGVEL